MPETDLMQLAAPSVRQDFDRLFSFASRHGVVNAGDRAHYSRRYATDPHGTRREIEMHVAGTITAKHGAIAQLSDVRALAEYPDATLPGDPTVYPEI
jgi:hypothetical protein